MVNYGKRANKNSAQGLIEILLISALVMVTAVVVWGLYSKKTTELANLSTVKTKNATNKADDSSFADRLAKYKNNLNDSRLRVEVAGAIGKLIAQYKQSNDDSLRALIASCLSQLSEADGNTISDNKIDSCISQPSTCDTLATITDFNWKSLNPESALSSTKCSSYDSPLPMDFSYTNSYINDNGEVVQEVLKQSVRIQKEQYQTAEYSGMYLNEFLNSYMATKFSDDLFTGSAVSVQEIINSYLTGTNCELSKSKSQYIDFANHNVR